MSERRTYARKSTSDYFLVYDRETDALIGRVLDLTKEGAMIISDAPVAVPTSIKCRMVMPKTIGASQFISFDAESRWCLENKRCNWYETGYRLFNIAKEDQEIITQLIGDWVVRTGDRSLTVTVSPQ